MPAGHEIHRYDACKAQLTATPAVRDNFPGFRCSPEPSPSPEPTAHVKPSRPIPDTSPSRDELCRRIDDELARLGEVEVSAWMVAQPPPPPASELENGRARASDVEVDAALGALLWRARGEMHEAPCFHAMGADAMLVAVLRHRDRHVGVRPLIAVDELDQFTLRRRPVSADDIPPGYRRTSTAALLWRFALFDRDGEQALPREYRLRSMRLGPLPPLDRSLVAGRHFKLMKSLQDRARSFEELRAITDLSAGQLSRDLGALLLVGSLVVA